MMTKVYTIDQTEDILVRLKESIIDPININLSDLSQLVGGFDLRIQNVESSISNLTQTVNGFDSRITSAENNASSALSSSNKIDWLIKSGTSSTDFTLTDKVISIMKDNIKLDEYVTFTKLKTSGQAQIDAGNIVSGTLDGSKVNIINLQINNLRYGTYPVITCTGSYGNPTIVFGRSQSGSSVSPDDISICGSTINIGNQTGSLYDVNVKAGYIKLICGTSINIGTSNYYAIMNSNREFRPSAYGTSYPFYLGTSNYPWHYGYITNLNVGSYAKLGSSSSAKIGFFGTTPISRKSVSSSATIATLISALKDYGLIN